MPDYIDIPDHNIQKEEMKKKRFKNKKSSSQELKHKEQMKISPKRDPIVNKIQFEHSKNEENTNLFENSNGSISLKNYSPKNMKNQNLKNKDKYQQKNQIAAGR